MAHPPAPRWCHWLPHALGWRLEEPDHTGLHAAPFARLRPHLARGCRIIATLREGDAPAALADWLVAAGAGSTRG